MQREREGKGAGSMGVLWGGQPGATAGAERTTSRSARWRSARRTGACAQPVHAESILTTATESKLIVGAFRGVQKTGAGGGPRAAAVCSARARHTGYFPAARWRHLPSRALPLLFSILSAVPTASAMGGSLQFSTQSRLFLLADYCFDAGAFEIDFLIQPEDGRSELYEPSLLVCKEHQFFNLQSEAALACDLTRFANMAAAGCSVFPVTLGGTSRVAEGGIDGRRYFVFRICPQNASASYNASIVYRFVNADGDHLGCEQMRKPEVYFFLTWLWALTLVVWLGSWARRSNEAVTLHKLMSAVPAAQAIHCLAEHFVWSLISRTGLERRELVIVVKILSAANRGVFFTTLLALARGWLVLRWDISLTERRTGIFCLSWVVVSYFSYDLFQGLFLFMLVFVVMIVLRLIFTSIAYNYQVLLVQNSIMEELRRPRVEILTSREFTRIYRGFRTAMGLYLFNLIALQVVQSFALNNDLQYAYVAAMEALDWALVIGVGFLFRARDAPTVSAEEEEEARVEGEREAGEAEAEAVAVGVAAVKAVLVVHPSASGSRANGFARIVRGAVPSPCWDLNVAHGAALRH